MKRPMCPLYYCSMSMHMRIQAFFDALLARTVLPFIPHRVTPNMVSWSRIVSLPFIFWLLYTERYYPGSVLFTLAALTDALDGAMARTRDQVTETGKILDAVADRGLIAVAVLLLIPPLFGWTIVFVLAALELLNGIAAYRARRLLGYNPGANWAGKAKMATQSVAIIALIVGLFLSAERMVLVSYVLLVSSLGFALIQSFAYHTPWTRRSTASV